jgi:hypothetical protein
MAPPVELLRKHPVALGLASWTGSFACLTTGKDYERPRIGRCRHYACPDMFQIESGFPGLERFEDPVLIIERIELGTTQKYCVSSDDYKVVEVIPVWHPGRPVATMSGFPAATGMIARVASFGRKWKRFLICVRIASVTL